MNLGVKYFYSTRLLIVVFAAFPAIESNASSHCETYSNLNSQMSCESDKVFYSDYLRNYGAYYCEKFNVYADGLLVQDPKYKFIRSTTYCLQNALIQSYLSNQLSCQNLEAFAYQSHYDCYLENGFCELSPADQIKVGKVAFKRELSMRPLFTLRQVFKIIRMCNP